MWYCDEHFTGITTGVRIVYLEKLTRRALVSWPMTLYLVWFMLAYVFIISVHSLLSDLYGFICIKEASE